jgi:hypothetical protein
LQPVAISGKSDRSGIRQNERNPSPSLATSCLRSSMVRRGSTVRVRQRALQRPCKPSFSSPLILHSLQRAPGMEPIMELPGSRRRSSSPHASRPGPAADLRVFSDNADSEIGVRDDQRPRWRPLVVERPTCLRRDLSLLRLDLRHEGVELRRVDTNRPKLVDVEWNSVLRADEWTVRSPVACQSASS